MPQLPQPGFGLAPEWRQQAPYNGDNGRRAMVDRKLATRSVRVPATRAVPAGGDIAAGGGGRRRAAAGGWWQGGCHWKAAPFRWVGD